MYNLKKEPYGVRMSFEGFVKQDHMTSWLQDSQSIIPSLGKDFNVFVDMRTMMPLAKEAQQVMEEGQKLYKNHGMKRSVVILNSPTLAMQFMRIAKETGIYEWERYIDASKNADWEKAAMAWIQNGVDPDANNR